MRKTIIILLVSLTGTLQAQQLFRFSQSFNNQLFINPGAIGVENNKNISMLGRWQWIGFGDEPRTALLNFNMVKLRNEAPSFNSSLEEIKSTNENDKSNLGKMKHAFGMQFLSDQYGAFKMTGGALNYAIHLPINSKSNISFGVKAGLSNYNFDKSKASVSNISNMSLQYNGGDSDYDQFILDQSSRYIGDVSAGLYYYSKRSYFGIAIDNLTKNFISFGSGTANFDLHIHYAFSGGYKFVLNPDFNLSPNFIVRYMHPAPISIEISAITEYQNWFWAGLGYRYNDALIGMFGMKLKNKFRLGYSYDMNISSMRGQNKGGHELVLGMIIGK